MNKLQEWNAFVVSARLSGNTVDIRAVIRDYITRYQRVTRVNVRNYVYSKYGDKWRSQEFDAYIYNQLDSLTMCGDVSYDGYYYVTASAK